MRKSLLPARLAPMLAPMLALTLAFVPACSPQAAAPSAGQGETLSGEQAATTHPVSGLDVIPLTVTTTDGPHRFMVEVARTDAEQQQGLMFRREMGADEGMIFPRNPPRMASFWMKNTVLSLDIIFIGPDGRVINVAAGAVPYSLDPVPSDAPAAAVLELNAGRAAELGIGPGTLITW